MDYGGDDALPDDILVFNDGGYDEFNISDIIDAIHIADPSFEGSGAPAAAQQPPAMQASAPAPDQRPYARIIEQPASKSLRFRYLCEGRSAGSIPGANNTAERRTYPAIEICNYRGTAVVIVSCVTANDNPPRPHPHNLVGRDKCKDGIYSTKVTITAENNTVTFPNLGIQCVKKKDILHSLQVRERMSVDPFKTGYSHKNQPQSIDLNMVKFCFQVFVHDKTTNKPHMSLPPVVSDVIYDKKAMSDPLIMRLSRCSGSVRGGDEIIILCEKVTREEIRVVFYLEENGVETWSERGNISLVHKQVAIVVETPPYSGPKPATNQQIHVNIKLQRTDGECSPPVNFEYIPLADDVLGGKRRKTGLTNYLQSFEQQRSFIPDNPIKTEPRDRTPHHVYSPTDVSFQQWQQQASQPGPSMHLGGQVHQNPFNQWAGGTMQEYNMQSVGMQQNIQGTMHSPMHEALSPMHGGVSPMHGGMSPMQVSMQGGVSPLQQGVSMQGGVSPMHNVSMQGGVSPMHNVSMQGGVSPLRRVSPMPVAGSPLHQVGMQGGVSPLQAGMSGMHVTPMHGTVSPGLQQPMMIHQPVMQQVMESEAASISGLLDGSGPMPQFTSGDLTQLTQLLEGSRNDFEQPPP